MAKLMTSGAAGDEDRCVGGGLGGQSSGKELCRYRRCSISQGRVGRRSPWEVRFGRKTDGSVVKP